MDGLYNTCKLLKCVGCMFVCICTDILEQSAVWVDEVNYYDLRLNRNKGISPLSLRQADPLGIETDKYVKAGTDIFVVNIHKYNNVHIQLHRNG